jgi:hypothetical protein
VRNFASLVILTAVPLAAQWLNYPTPGIPRRADGKPNLSAPAPRTAYGKPDLSGLWRMRPGFYSGNIAADLKPDEVQPWAETLSRQRAENLGKDDPNKYQCLPRGPYRPNPTVLVKIIQTPALIVMLSEDLTYRQIFLDGRALPEDPNPSYMGYSVGHWDGDALVVESVGFNDRTWLDAGGHPHTEALHLRERFVRRNFGSVDIQETFDDPRAFNRPWTVSFGADFAPDTELIEYVCNENERDSQHHVGKASDDKAIEVSPSILLSYVGVYDVPAWGRTRISLLGNELTVERGGSKAPLKALSETTFAMPGYRVQFSKDSQGIVTLSVGGVEGDQKAVRKPE